jgi:hypothetical protein
VETPDGEVVQFDEEGNQTSIDGQAETLQPAEAEAQSEEHGQIIQHEEENASQGNTGGNDGNGNGGNGNSGNGGDNGNGGTGGNGGNGGGNVPGGGQGGTGGTPANPSELLQGSEDAKDFYSSSYDTDTWTYTGVFNPEGDALDHPYTAGGLYYDQRYYLLFDTPEGGNKISGDFSSNDRLWNWERFHLSGDQPSDFWQEQSDFEHGG